MLDFVRPNPGGEPIYLQIVRQFKLLVLQNRLKNGDEVPSRRVLAAQLGVNPNTVQKAFADLEKLGLIKTPPNAKSIIAVNDEMLAALRAELLEGQVSSLVDAAHGAGISRNHLVSMINTDWENRIGEGVSDETLFDTV